MGKLLIVDFILHNILFFFLSLATLLVIKEMLVCALTDSCSVCAGRSLITRINRKVGPSPGLRGIGALTWFILIIYWLH